MKSTMKNNQNPSMYLPNKRRNTACSDIEIPLPSSSATIRTMEPPDGGWGWLVVFVSFMNFFLLPGVIRSYGVIHMHILAEFPEVSEAKVSLIPSLLSTLTIALAPVTSIMYERFNISRTILFGGAVCSLGLIASFFSTSVEYLIFSYGACVGTGAGLCTAPCILLVARYFKKKRALSSGLCVAGTSVGCFILPPIAEILCERYTFRGTLLILGGLTMNVCVLSQFLQPPEYYYNKNKNNALLNAGNEYEDSKEPPLPNNAVISTEIKTEKPEINGDYNQQEKQIVQINNNVNNLKQKTDSVEVRKVKKHKFGLDFSYLLDPVFCFTALAGTFYRFGIPQALFYFPAHAANIGIGKREAALLLSINAACDMTGRMGFGWISDKRIIKRIHEYSITVCIAALGVLTLLFAKSYSAMVVASILFGSGAGSSIILLPVILSDNHNSDDLPSTLGIVRIFQTFSTFIAPIITGLVKDSTGKYEAAFSFATVVLVLAAISMQISGMDVLRNRRRCSNADQNSKTPVSI